MKAISGIIVGIKEDTLGNLSFWRGFITFTEPPIQNDKYAHLVPSEVEFNKIRHSGDGSVTFEFSTLHHSVINDFHNTREWAEEEADRLITALCVLAEYEPFFEAGSPEENSETLRSFYRACEAEGVSFHLNSAIAAFLLDTAFVSETDWDTLYLVDVALSCFQADWLKEFLRFNASQSTESTLLPGATSPVG